MYFQHETHIFSSKRRHSETKVVARKKIRTVNFGFATILIENFVNLKIEKSIFFILNLKNCLTV